MVNHRNMYLDYLCSHPDYYSHNNQSHPPVAEVESSATAAAEPKILKRKLEILEQQYLILLKPTFKTKKRKQLNQQNTNIKHNTP